MKSIKNVLMVAILVTLTVALLVAPVTARQGYDNIDPGDTIYIYEAGLNVANLTSGNGTITRLVHYSGDVGTSGTDDNINIGNASNFEVFSTVKFPGEVYYAWNAGGFINASQYVVIDTPSVSVDVMLANANDILNDKTITKGTNVQFRLRSNVPAGFDVVNGFPPYVELRFTNPDAGTVNVFGNSTGLGTFNLTEDQTRTAVLDTSDVDTGNWAVKAYWKNSGAFTDFYGDGVDSSLVSFSIGTAKPTISVSTDEVIRGDGFTATITGRGSTDFWIFVEDAALDCDEYPVIDPFGNGTQPGVTTNADVASIAADGGEASACVGTFARARTNAAGTRTVTFGTNDTTDDRSFTLNVIEVGDANADDSQSVRVAAGAVTIDAEGEKVYYVGEEVTFMGECTACRANEEIYLYILGPNLPDCGGTMDDPFADVVAPFDAIDVESDDSWEFDWDTSRIPTIDAGTYSIYAVSAEVDKCDLGDADNVANGEEEYAIVTVQLRRPFITASLPATRVAKGDDLVITGTAEGLPDDVFIWIFGPNIPQAFLDRSVSVEDDLTFEETIENTEDLQSGQYFVVVQHPMYNGEQDVVLNGTSCGVENLVSGDIEFYACAGAAGQRLMGSDAANALVDVLDDPRIDDTYVKLFFLLEEAYVNIDAISDKYVGEKFTITGTTNVAADDTLLITINSASFQPTDKTQAGEFSGVAGSTKVVKGTGADNTWSFEVDATGFKPDQYIVKAEVVETDTIATTTFFVAEVPPTTVTAPPTATTPAPVTTTAVATTTVPPTTTPGFGAVIALIGLGAVAVLVLRRH